jgi:hypothetical protein
MEAAEISANSVALNGDLSSKYRSNKHDIAYCNTSKEKIKKQDTDK